MLAVRSPVPASNSRPILPLEIGNKTCHSEFQQILSIYLCDWEKKLQIDPKWSETCKKQETGDTEFSPVASASNRQSTNLPLENVDTNYHTKFPQILSINVAWVPKH